MSSKAVGQKQATTKDKTRGNFSLKVKAREKPGKSLCGQKGQKAQMEQEELTERGPPKGLQMNKKSTPATGVRDIGHSRLRHGGTERLLLASTHSEFRFAGLNRSNRRVKRCTQGKQRRRSGGPVVPANFLPESFY